MAFRGIDRAHAWPRRAVTVALALSLALPGPVYPCTMDQLLSLSLDCLLRIEFTPPGAVHRASDCGASVTCTAVERGVR